MIVWSQIQDKNHSIEAPRVLEPDGQVIEADLEDYRALTPSQPDHEVKHLALYATFSSPDYRLGLVYWDQTDQAFKQTGVIRPANNRDAD